VLPGTIRFDGKINTQFDNAHPNVNIINQRQKRQAEGDNVYFIVSHLQLGMIGQNNKQKQTNQDLHYIQAFFLNYIHTLMHNFPPFFLFNYAVAFKIL
jgi:hypothetical protein